MSDSAQHRLVDGPAGRIHLVEQGNGPLVLLVHGFPESWYSWRHQLPALAAAGYRAVAIDVRGYGRSSKPPEIDAYRLLELVADDEAILHALGADNAAIVGHDWGSSIASTSALLRPDLFPAVALLSVPYAPPGGPRPTDAFAMAGGDEEFYVSYFQRPGRAEAEIEPDVRGWLRGFFTALSGDAPAAGDESVFTVPAGARMRDRFPHAPLPSWLTESDLDTYAAEFERTGTTGALNRYRNVDRDWEDLADRRGAALLQPALFVAGAQDASLTWMADAVSAFPKTLPALTGAHTLDGAGHWIQQERPQAVNELLIDWLSHLPR
jgi:pimeloyl-ACP methyl ester carboxylesterase